MHEARGLRNIAYDFRDKRGVIEGRGWCPSTARLGNIVRSGVGGASSGGNPYALGPPPQLPPQVPRYRGHMRCCHLPCPLCSWFCPHAAKDQKPQKSWCRPCSRTMAGNEFGVFLSARREGCCVIAKIYIELRPTVGGRGRRCRCLDHKFLFPSPSVAL